MQKDKLIVVGSFVVDLATKTPKLPRRGETIFGGPFTMGPGGKGSNQCIAAKRAGADVVFLTKLGRDLFADVALEAYRAEGIDASYVFRDEILETGSALIMVENQTGENAIVVSSGACKAIQQAELDQIQPAMEHAKVLLTQFEINMDAVWHTLKMARAHNLITIVNPAPVQAVNDAIFEYIDIITPNETEAEALTGIPITDDESAGEAAGRLLEKGVKHVLITLGEKGVYYQDAQHHQMINGYTVPQVIDTTGAGDAFNGGFATAITEGMEMENAIIFGNAVGALSVTKNGTAPSMPYRIEIEAFMNKHIKKAVPE